jgi:hypothetical protein
MFAAALHYCIIVRAVQGFAAGGSSSSSSASGVASAGGDDGGGGVFAASSLAKLCAHPSLCEWASEFRSAVASSVLFDEAGPVDQQVGLSLMEISRRGIDDEPYVHVVYVHWVWTVSGTIVRPDEMLGRLVELTGDHRVKF